MRNTVPGWRQWSAWSFLFVLPSVPRTVGATSIKWLFANQFEEITWNWDADSNSKANSLWYPMLIQHYPGYHSAFHYNKPLSIKFSSAYSWGHNWQNPTVNSFHWNVDKFVYLFVCLFVCFFMYVANYFSGKWVIVQDIVPRAIIPLWLLIVPTEDTPKIGHVQRAIVWTFFILSHPLVSPFTLVLRFARKLRSPCMARKASVMQATPGCPVPIFSYFF